MSSPRNVCELEIDLFCRGLRIGDGVSLHAARSISRTRAGLGSGLELALPTGMRRKPLIYVNVPVVEPFAAASPYVLTGAPDTGYSLIDQRTTARYDAIVPREPAWYSRPTSRGVAMHRIGVLQGTYLAIYLNPVCAFWSYRPALNCRFCTTGQNVGTAEVAEKSIDDVVEVCRAAREESGVTFVHFNGGFQGSRGLEFAAPFVAAVKERVGLLVGVQLTPERQFERYDRLIALGVDHLSFCVEFFDPEWFARVCPGKERMLGQQLFWEAMGYAADLLPRGAVSGEIIAGLEPIDATLAAIDRITSLGAFPTVCIFRPTRGSDLEHAPPPAYEDMRRVMQYVYDACRRHWIPIGAAPDIEVSLVVNPDDAALLARASVGVWLFEAWRRMVKVAARPAFARRMRPRARAG